MADPFAEKHIQRFSRIKSDRAVWESHWQEIKNFILPLSQSFTGLDTRGQKVRHEILDNSTESASELLAGGIMGWLMNPGSKWHGMRPKRRELLEDPAVAKWLEAVTDILFVIYESRESRFYPQMGRAVQELADFGTGGIWPADRPGKIPLFQHLPLTELHLLENAEGFIDTVYRNPDMTARQAVQFFGDRVNAKAHQAVADGKGERMFHYIHAVFPRAEEDRRGGSRLPRDKAFASLWISIDDKITVRESGADELPLIAGRWHVRGGETYGRGPGMKALADVKMLQRGMKATIRAAEKLIDPPLMVADDGVMGPIRTNSSGINVVRSDLVNTRRPAIEALNTGGRPDIGEEFLDRVRLRIERAYFNHLLALSRDPRMTATQVLKLDEETLRVLGPFLGNVISELIAPVVERTFAIALRGGLLPPPPPALEGEAIEVEFVSPIAKAQRLGEVTALSQFLDITNPMRAVNGEVDDNLDMDLAYRMAADRLGVPKVVLRDKRLVEQVREARGEAQQAEADAESAERAAAAAQSAGQAMAAINDNAQAA